MFTIKDFIKLNCFNDISILTGKEKIDNIPIEHIAVIELPVDDFIRQNELVLTTAIGCLYDTELFLSFVKSVYLSKAAGLVLSVKDENYIIPQQIINYAESIDFPILVIAWKYRFAEIVEKTITCIKKYDKEKKHFFDKIQKNLLSIYLESKDLSSAAQIISKHLQLPIIIVDVDYTIKGSSEHVNTYSLQLDALMNDFEVLANIQIKDTIHGYLLKSIKNQSHVPVTKDFEYLLTMPLSLWFEKENIINSTKLKLVSDFVWNLALDKFNSLESLNTKAKLMGFNLLKPYTCIVGEIKLDTFINQINPNHIYSINSKMNNIVNKIRLLAVSHNKEIMITSNDNLILFYLENTKYETKLSIYKFLDNIDNMIKDIDQSLRCFWGISEIKYKETNFHKYYLNARMALNISHKTVNNNRSSYEDTSLLKILSKLIKEEEINEIVSSILDGLIEYDKSKNSVLLKTFKTFTKNNYNISKTARELHLHRQSLIYRLDKIEKLTNLSLEKHENLLLLELCSRLYSE